jgi:hypothetical protein
VWLVVLWVRQRVRQAAQSQHRPQAYSCQAVAVAVVCLPQQRLLVAHLQPRFPHTYPHLPGEQQVRQVSQAALGKLVWTFLMVVSYLVAVAAVARASQQLPLRLRVMAAMVAMAAVAVEVEVLSQAKSQG